MKLISARVKNFRLLKDINIDFASSSEKNITVIRAANESGKTTLLTALQWGLFGEDGLPDSGSGFRISPIDIVGADGRAKADISVEILFEVKGKISNEKYRLRRLVTEKVKSNEFERVSDTVILSKVTSDGEKPIDFPESNIRRFIPLQLREIFFTDGDRALSFIEGKKRDKQKRIEDAIKSLLGLDIISDTLDHVDKISSALNRKVRNVMPYDYDVQEVAEEIEEYTIDINKLSERVKSLKGEVQNLEELEKEADKRLEDALRRGNREDLINQKNEAKREWEKWSQEEKNLKKEQSQLFKDRILGQSLLVKQLQKASKFFKELEESRKIPTQTIPVLNKYLEKKSCICGESLTKDTDEGLKRRQSIKDLIKESKEADEINSKLTELYYSSNDLLNVIKSNHWESKVNELEKKRLNAKIKLEEYGSKQREVEAKIDKIPDVDLSQLRQTRNAYKKDHREKSDELVREESRLKEFELKKIEAEKERKKLLDKEEIGKKIQSQLTVADNISKILNSSLERIRNEELNKVSTQMNEIFLEMIGSDKSQRAIIKKAVVSHDFEILVFGHENQRLDPSDDLNGASRRALTLAFILALTKVSEVEAPNVIDTPLGMMSGYVKRSVLYNAAEKSSQLVLLLTRSEINDCEDILDRKANSIYTFTNPAHYPKILENEPPISDSRILVCNCNHKESCSICERKQNIDYYNNE